MQVEKQSTVPSFYVLNPNPLPPKHMSGVLGRKWVLAQQAKAITIWK